MSKLTREFIGLFIMALMSSTLTAKVTTVNSNLEDAMRDASPGDTLIVAEKTWVEDENVWIKEDQTSGSQNNYITVMGAPGTKPVLEGGFLIETDYWRFVNLHFKDGANLELGGDGHQAINCSWVGSGFSYAALTIAVGVSDILVEGCYFEIANRRSVHHAIYAHAADNVVIRNNLISSYGEGGMKGYGIHIYDEDKGKGLDRIANNYLIENNIVHGAKERAGIIIAYGGDGAELYGAVVRNNVVYNCNIGIYVKNHVFNVKLYNNTIFNMVGDNTKGIYLKYFESNIEVKNNIIYTSSGPHIRLTQPNNPTLDIDNNLYYPGAILDDISDKNPMIADPGFVSTDTDNPDLHLQAGSPAIDSGIDLGIPFAGSAPDLGAYEYGDITTDSSNRGIDNNPQSFRLHQNYPNPFNPNTRIAYDIQTSARVSIKVYNAIGVEVASLVDSEMPAGSHSVEWNGIDRNGNKSASGIYLYRINVFARDSNASAAKWTETRKMILLQ